MEKMGLKAACILLPTILVLSSFGQVQNGQLVGLVTDPTGAVLADAFVHIRSQETGFQLDVQTNAIGTYTAKELPVGRYRVTVEAPGFKTTAHSDLAVNAGTVLRVDFRLDLGPGSETTEVLSTPPVVNTDNARLAEIVDSTEIANLPLNGRNVFDLIKYAPGATDVSGVIFENGANTVVNGVRENFNNFLINGVSNKGLSGGVVNQPILDTVQEFQVLTLNNSAEFGNSAGSITNLVTKSGTNNYHGSAWWFVRNDVFDANNFFLNRVGEDKPALRFNQFGGTLGGALRKNKFFFFAAYQGDRFLTSAPPVPVSIESPEFRQAVSDAFPDSIAALLYHKFPPAPGGVQGTLSLNQYVATDLSGSGFTTFPEYLCRDLSSQAIASRFATLFGVTAADQAAMANPSLACSSIPPLQSGRFDRDAAFLIDTVAKLPAQVETFTGGNLFQGDEASLRLDYNFSQKDRVFGQTNWSHHSDRFGSYAPLPLFRGFSSPAMLTAPNVQFSYIHVFTRKLLNEFRAGYAGSISQDGLIQPGIPSIRFDDSSVGFGAYNGYPDFFKEHIYTYADMVSISHDKHNLKMGVDLRRNLENSNWDVSRPSYYFFDPLFFAADAPYDEFAAVDPGIISSKPAQLAKNVRHFRNWELGLYLQDDWRVSRNLSLNLGLRYDLYTRHTELGGLATTFLLGPGTQIVDNLQTGAGRLKSASVPAGSPGCDQPAQIRLVQIAGVCGPGGFAPAASLGAGDHNDFGPRVGFAWDVFGNGKTSLRGGLGISYEGTLYNPLSNSRWNPPYFSYNSVQNFLVGDINHVTYGPQSPGQLPRFTGAPDPANFQGRDAAAVGNISAWDPANPNLASLTAIVLPEGLRDPYVMNWFLGVQREVRPNLVLEANYVGTMGRKLFRAEFLNRVPGGRLPAGTCAKDNLGRTLCSQVDLAAGSTGDPLNPLGRVNPNFDFIRAWKNVVNSSYHGLQVSATKRMGRGIQFAANYTWSHSIDDSSTWHNSQTSANGHAAGEGGSTDPSIPGLDRGNSVFDIRHRLVFSYVWELPFFVRTTGFAKAALGGWQINGIWSFQSGAHWSPFDRRPLGRFEDPDACAPNAQGFISDPPNCTHTGGDYNLDGIQNDRPNAAAANFDASHDDWANGFNLPPGFFSSPCLGCIGNLRRNSFVGPGYWAGDVSAFKNFQLTDRVDLQFKAETFNVLNHTNFQLPGSGFVENNRINSLHFGQSAGTFSPRNLQLGLKLSF